MKKSSICLILILLLSGQFCIGQRYYPLDTRLTMLDKELDSLDFDYRFYLIRSVPTIVQIVYDDDRESVAQERDEYEIYSFAKKDENWCMGVCKESQSFTFKTLHDWKGFGLTNESELKMRMEEFPDLDLFWPNSFDVWFRFNTGDSNVFNMYCFEESSYEDQKRFRQVRQLELFSLFEKCMEQIKKY